MRRGAASSRSATSRATKRTGSREAADRERREHGGVRTRRRSRPRGSRASRAARGAVMPAQHLDRLVRAERRVRLRAPPRRRSRTTRRWSGGRQAIPLAGRAGREDRRRRRCRPGSRSARAARWSSSRARPSASSTVTTGTESPRRGRVSSTLRTGRRLAGRGRRPRLSGRGRCSRRHPSRAGGGCRRGGPRRSRARSSPEPSAGTSPHEVRCCHWRCVVVSSVSGTCALDGLGAPIVMRPTRVSPSRERRLRLGRRSGGGSACHGGPRPRPWRRSPRRSTPGS